MFVALAKKQPGVKETAEHSTYSTPVGTPESEAAKSQAHKVY